MTVDFRSLSRSTTSIPRSTTSRSRSTTSRSRSTLRSASSLDVISSLQLPLLAAVALVLTVSSTTTSSLRRTSSSSSSSTYPITLVRGQWPGGPINIDMCTGLREGGCKFGARDGGECRWDTSQYPHCFNRNYRRKEAPYGRESGVGAATKFFVFSWGVHLSEGSIHQWYYNTGLEECADLCLRSPVLSRPPTPNPDAGEGVRCMSFDFYPFEDPWIVPPWNESVSRGMCVLNSENKDTARLRNEDLGFTDAEFFYTSHYTNRPFSDFDGYYELRDPRGDATEALLQYDQVNPSLNLISVWGKSRWGAYFMLGPVRKPPITKKLCEEGTPPADRDPEKFFVGFTPVDDRQKCVGLQTKEDAKELCEAAGGQLCFSSPQFNQETGRYFIALDELFGKKIGCGLDGQQGQNRFPIWQDEDDPVDGNGNPIEKFVRCCGEFRSVTNCERYLQENIDFCSQFKSASDCVNQASGKAQQEESGFGLKLDEFRRECQRAPSDRCKSVMVRDWTVRDRCVWCVRPGEGISGGEGECRAGGDYGICENAPIRTKNMFEIRIKRTCGASSVCPVVRAYPDLEDELLDPEPGPPTPPPTLQPCSELSDNHDECVLRADCSWELVDSRSRGRTCVSIL